MSDIKKVARVIYLNKTCFNGLYRVNRAGEFNVPFGNYRNPKIINEPVLRAVSKYFNENDIRFFCGDYSDVLKITESDTFVYLDPPYYPVSETANFTAYSQNGFSKAEQIRLRENCDALNKRGIRFMLSNSASKFIVKLYDGYNITFVKAKRAVNSVGSKRGYVDEIVVRNYE